MSRDVAPLPIPEGETTVRDPPTGAVGLPCGPPQRLTPARLVEAIPATDVCLPRQPDHPVRSRAEDPRQRRWADSGGGRCHTGPVSDVIDVRLHEENGTWWAESEQIPGLSVVADSRAQLVDALRGAVAFALEIDPDEVQDATGAASSPNVSIVA